MFAAVAGTLTIAAGGTAYAASGWTAVSVPPTGNNVSLLGAAALSSTDAWAVGQQFAAAGKPAPPPVTYHWDGSAWSLKATPSLGQLAALDSVSASSANDAWAVGFTEIGHLDFGTLIEHWDGSAWTATSVDAITGSAARLTGVADLGPKNAWAVGEGSTGGLAEHWNGSTWTVVPLPDSAFTPANGHPISATSARNIWLVGTTLNSSGTPIPESLHFDGTTWTVVPVALPNATTSALNAVTAISAKNVWAAGEDNANEAATGGSTLVEHWNGTAWRIFKSPTPGGDPSLSGVAARSASDVYAVGTNLPSVNGGPEQAMILRWNGTKWSVDSSGVFTGQLFAAAAAPGAAQEWAVGTTDQALVLSHG